MIRQFFVLELLSISLVQYIIFEGYGNEKIYANLRNITYYLHMSFICILGIFFPRIDPSDPSISTLTNTLNERRGRIGKRSEYVLNINHYNNLIICLLKSLCRMCIGNSSTSESSSIYNYSENIKIRSQNICRPKPIFTIILDKIKKIDNSNITELSIKDLVKTALNKSMDLIKRQRLFQSNQLCSNIIKEPFLPPMDSTSNISKEEFKETESNEQNTEIEKTKILKKYTLVLDLDETLVHYQEINGDGKLLIRPGVDTFLNEVSKYYEVVIFTAALREVLLFLKLVCKLGNRLN